MSETTTVEQAAPPAPSLTIADLVMTAQIIQVAAQKGVFKPEEFKAVGDFYDRLLRFLESSGAVTRTPPAQPTEAAPTDDAPEEKADA